MSRSGYTDDMDDILAHGRWRGAVASSIRGKRGQALLRELAAQLDAMPEKRLIAHELQADGEFCTLGVLGAARGIDMSKLDPEDYDGVAAAFGIAPCMAQEIVYENDERFDDYEWITVTICGPMRDGHWDGRQWIHEQHQRTIRMTLSDGQEKRWRYMRKWVQDHLKP